MLDNEIIRPSKISISQGSFIAKLQKQMQDLQPRKESHGSKRKIFIHKDLNTCSRVFSVKKTLETPYRGPFLVKKRQEKYFLLQINGKEVNISIDRLKPAYLLCKEDPEPTRVNLDPGSPDSEKITAFQGARSSLRRTITGRPVKKSVRFKDEIKYRYIPLRQNKTLLGYW
ncbi:hypothetical protein LAZ67_X003567 [Cordylochernes scorpioides]|uniref:Uncharacterized protein n=1 Tax=Cordylochernes scorpioides TaxID=51811 RepID=A0ABY6LYC5_9ARAC|nr:hypothetical protein LAZ67_X003567 [Cordylochernes scorpioides]